ncbi:NAD(P)-binding protein [Guyanagaster necrorhizus]|uniref:NAD(P)-binding protein n=1 Tax=Guyanagaster necrorhizus TaxID=856835 RepID=A0A9P7VJI6_9AGAR|nr:NAD(P)-binding protein [Guyanagaster necrorhizus MCA 3950]KAG7441685.1 NAD(P)-binding protein [Guyanagaster necrorhizus MCA 3950]
MGLDLYLNGVALVVGAGSGMGRATALAFAEAGVRGLIFADIRDKAAAEVAEEAKAVASDSQFESFVIQVDMGDEESVKNLMAKSVEKFGRVDYCANIAGSFGRERKPFAETPTEEWLAIQQTNINGVFFLVKEQIKIMEKQERLVTPLTSEARPAERGSIVVLSSAAAVIAVPEGGAYTHTKFATNGLTKAAAQDHGKNGIRINAILPGYIFTPGLAAFPGATPETAQRILDNNALHRFGEPREIGDMVAILSSPRNSYMIGASILIDGGQTITAE